MSDSQFQALTTQMHMWKQMIEDTLKVLLPKCLEALLNTMSTNLPEKAKNETMSVQIHSIVEQHFESSDEDESDGEDEPQPAASKSVRNKPQQARFVAGKRRPQKQKNKTHSTG